MATFVTGPGADADALVAGCIHSGEPVVGIATLTASAANTAPDRLHVSRPASYPRGAVAIVDRDNSSRCLARPRRAEGSRCCIPFVESRDETVAQLTRLGRVLPELVLLGLHDRLADVRR